MKPRFAISFSEDGLALLHRERRGWLEVGRTDFDTPDLVQAMDWLRSSALGLAPEGITTTLVLPNSQILYTQITVSGADDAARRDEIASALVGRTPYDVSELVFDYGLQGDVAQVAVVARETLDEAEGFAATYGLNPVSFTAVPQEGAFDGAPFFGTTAFAATILTHGQVVKRETRPVVATRRDLPVADSPVAEDATTPAPIPVQADLPLLDGTVSDAAALDVVAADPDLPEAEPEPEQEPEVTPEDPAAPVADPADVPEELPQDAPDEMPDDAPAEDPAEYFPQPDEMAVFDPLAVPVTSAFISPVDDVEEAPIALDVEDDEPEVHQPRIAHDGLSVTATDAPALDDDLPPAPSVAASLAFASRRAVAASVVPGGGAPAVARPVGGLTKPVGPATLPPVTAPASTVPVAPALPDDLGQAPAVPAEPPVAAKLETAIAAPSPAVPAVGPKPIKALGSMITAPGIPGTKNRKPDAAPVVTRPRVNVSTKPGAATTGKPADFKPRARQQVRGKPRYLGLILTGILLIFLAIAAAVSSLYIAGMDDTDPASTQTATTAPAGTADPASATTVPVAPATQTAADDPADSAPETPTAETPTAETPNPVAEAAPSPQVATSAATVAAGAGEQDEIRLSMADSAPSAADAGTLPAPQAQGDPPPVTQTEPPPFGTVYQFDENGLIKATPEGIVTPEGVVVKAGAPSLKPPPRPADLVPPAALAAAAPDAATPADTDLPPVADPALAAARPKARPADLVPATTTPATDPNAPSPQGAAPGDTTLVPAATPYTTGPRPLPRPAEILAAGLQAQQDKLAAASLAAAPDPNRSVLAVSVSRRPQPRPADMTRAVAAAVAAAARAPEPAAEPAPEQTAAAAPAAIEADAEPEEQAAMPAVPTRASVAKQATVANVLSMSKLSLIGVYGTSSKRYAMVRQSNGSYKKVAVGDRLDGGQVAAITDSELRYQKGGRMLVLSMPRG